MMYSHFRFKIPACFGGILDRLNKTSHSILNWTEANRPFLWNCAVIWVAVKIGLILLATASVITLLLIPLTRQLSSELSTAKVICIASPLTFLIALKLYFMYYLIASYKGSSFMFKYIFMRLLRGSKHCLRWLFGRETLDTPSYVPVKVRNR